MAWRRLWFMVVVSRTAGMTGPVRRRAAGGFPARPGGKDHRQIPAHAVHPRPSHASDTAADPPVGVAGASVFPPGPAHVPGAIAGSGGRSRGRRSMWWSASL